MGKTKKKAERTREIADDATLTLVLTEAIKPFLSGRGPGVQSAVLANLTALWLAGHIVPGSKAETAKVREGLLQDYVNLIRGLIEPSEREILDKIPPAGEG